MSEPDLFGERTTKRVSAAEKRRREAIEQLAADLNRRMIPQNFVDMLHRVVMEFADRRPKEFSFVDGNEVIGKLGVKYQPGSLCDTVAGEIPL